MLTLHIETVRADLMTRDQRDDPPPHHTLQVSEERLGVTPPPTLQTAQRRRPMATKHAIKGTTLSDVCRQAGASGCPTEDGAEVRFRVPTHFHLSDPRGRDGRVAEPEPRTVSPTTGAGLS